MVGMQLWWMYLSQNKRGNNYSELATRNEDNLLARGCNDGSVQVFNLAWQQPVVDKFIFRQVPQTQTFVNNITALSWVQGCRANLLGVGTSHGEVLVMAMTRQNK
eukprot:TRINITY_DN6127_c0_g1_i2.p7 TRINITY_DN6127_c0_g1~~TRINITY_DN6127_c0_g1_i2.p7  ORF type:complete len:105 (+),score=6.88 TRINITY_DN6127_c0_g1_i2:20-334(+)